VDNDSAEVTSSGRSFHVRGPTTGKARLVGDGCQLNRRHCRTVGANRTERSAARQVSDIVDWTKVLRFMRLFISRAAMTCAEFRFGRFKLSHYSERTLVHFEITKCTPNGTKHVHTSIHQKRGLLPSHLTIRLWCRFRFVPIVRPFCYEPQRDCSAQVSSVGSFVFAQFLPLSYHERASMGSAEQFSFQLATETGWWCESHSEHCLGLLCY